MYGILVPLVVSKSPFFITAVKTGPLLTEGTEVAGSHDKDQQVSMRVGEIRVHVT